MLCRMDLTQDLAILPESGFRGTDPRLTSLEVDLESGFLVSCRNDAITVEQKRLIVEYYREKGNLYEACRLAAVRPRSLRQVREVDETLNLA